MSEEKKIETKKNLEQEITQKAANVCKSAIQEVLTSVDHLDLGEMNISITLKDLHIDSKSEHR